MLRFVKQNFFIRTNTNFKNFIEFYLYTRRRIKKSIANRKKKNFRKNRKNRKKKIEKISTIIKLITLYFSYNNMRLC